MNGWLTAIQTAATLALLGVTYWYARTTKEMAGSAQTAAADSARATSAAERSAEAAERSAEAAREAATVAQSQIRPEFTGRLTSVMQKGDSRVFIACIQVTSSGDAVVVQRVRIRRAFRASYEPTDGSAAIANVDLQVYGDDSRLPQRLHHGEDLLLTHPDIQDARDDRFTRFLIDVDYTFSEKGEAGGKRQLVFDA